MEIIDLANRRNDGLAVDAFGGELEGDRFLRLAGADRRARADLGEGDIVEHLQLISEFDREIRKRLDLRLADILELLLRFLGDRVEQLLLRHHPAFEAIDRGVACPGEHAAGRRFIHAGRHSVKGES